MKREKIYEVNDFLKPYYEFELIDNKYVAIFATGDFDGNFDYDRGLLQVTIIFNSTHGEGEQLLGYITNIDDGVWQIYRATCLSQEEAMELCKDLKKQYGTRLPTEKILNEFLYKYRAYGLFTG
jgi:hypothetical protein